MATSFFYIYVMATSFFSIYVMAPSFFYIFAMATSFFYINLDIYIYIYKLTERPVVLLNAIFYIVKHWNSCPTESRCEELGFGKEDSAWAVLWLSSLGKDCLLFMMIYDDVSYS